VSKQKVVSTPVSAEVTAHSEKSAGPEQECLEDFDDNMNIDEEVDMNIDPLLREPRHQPKVGPSRSVLPSVTPSALIMPSRPSPPSVGLAETFASLSSIFHTADEGRPTNNSSSGANAEDVPSDPALQIDRLTGFSPPLTRTPRTSQKTVATARYELSNGVESND